MRSSHMKSDDTFRIPLFWHKNELFKFAVFEKFKKWKKSNAKSCICCILYELELGASVWN